MEPKYVTAVETPEPLGWGLFKVKGLERTIFRYEIKDGSIKVDNGNAFLRDTAESHDGKQINLEINEERSRQYERDIKYYLDEGKTSFFYTRKDRS